MSDLFGPGRGRQQLNSGFGHQGKLSLLKFVQSSKHSCGASHGSERYKDWRRMVTQVRDAPEHERDERIKTAHPHLT